MFGKPKFENYKPTDLDANNTAAEQAEAKSKADAEALEAANNREQMNLNPRNEIISRITDGDPSFKEATSKMIAETGAHLSNARDRAGEFITKSVEKGGKLFSSLKAKWGEGVQAIEKGAWKLGQKMVSAEDAINNGIDKLVLGVGDTATKVAELSSNWARETAEDCRKDIQAGVENTGNFLVEVYGNSKQGMEAAVNKSKNKYWGLKIGILKKLSGAGAALAAKAERGLAHTSQLRAIASGSETITPFANDNHSESAQSANQSGPIPAA